jgi:hypothetical protein
MHYKTFQQHYGHVTRRLQKQIDAVNCIWVALKLKLHLFDLLLISTSYSICRTLAGMMAARPIVDCQSCAVI